MLRTSPAAPLFASYAHINILLFTLSKGRYVLYFILQEGKYLDRISDIICVRGSSYKQQKRCNNGMHSGGHVEQQFSKTKRCLALINVVDCICVVFARLSSLCRSTDTRRKQQLIHAATLTDSAR